MFESFSAESISTIGLKHLVFSFEPIVLIYDKWTRLEAIKVIVPSFLGHTVEQIIRCNEKQLILYAQEVLSIFISEYLHINEQDFLDIQRSNTTYS